MHTSKLASPCPALELAQYLAAFPQERGALAELSAQLDDEPDEILLRSNMRGHITASAIVLDHNRTNVLLIDHIGLNAWLQPGGHYEAPGDLYESAMREVDEETGVTNPTPLRLVNGGYLLDIDTHDIGANPAKNEGAHRHHDYVYLVQAPYGVKLVPQLAEVMGAKWIALTDFYALPRFRFQRISSKLKALHF